MGLYNAMTTAISGLNAQSAKMGHISDNIANVNTTAYKKVGTSFSSLVTVSTPRVHEPSGVLSSPQYNTSLSGPVIASAINTNLAIAGNGFFKVKNVPNTTDTSGQDKVVYYTRKGDFNLDASGNLVNSSGYYLCGTPYNLDTGLLDATATGNAPINVGNITGVSRATSRYTIGANLPAAEANVVYGSNVTTDPNGVPILTSSGSNTTAAGFHTFISTSTTYVEQTLYDGQGIPHTMRAVFVPVTAGASAGNPASSPDSWTMVMVELDDTVQPPGFVEHFRLEGLTFRENGSLADVPMPTVTNNAGTGTMVSLVNGRMMISYDPPHGPVNPASSLSWAWDTTMAPIAIDLGTPGQPRGLVQNGTEYALNYAAQDGLPYGQFQKVSFDEYGDVYANFGNGLIKKIARAQVTVFSNPNGLQLVSGGAYSATVDSGDPIALDAGVGRAGVFVPSALEQSNVDLAEEFTNMIVAQRAYSANGKMITTADEMLDELIRLKR